MAEEAESVTLNLYQKLAKIRQMCDFATKDKDGYGYKYVGLDTILAKVSAGMKKYGVSLIPSITPETGVVTPISKTSTKMTRDGNPYQVVTNEYLYEADAIYTWINDGNPDEKISVPWHICGSNADPSMAGGSAASYFMRYFLINYFTIATSDQDIETYRGKQKEAEESEEKAVASGIIEQFDTIVREYLADNSDKSEEVKKFISKYAKNANYKNIKEPILAAKLLKDFQETFIGKEEK